MQSLIAIALAIAGLLLTTWAAVALQNRQVYRHCPEELRKDRRRMVDGRAELRRAAL